jgi:hypothetical protein
MISERCECHRSGPEEMARDDQEIDNEPPMSIEKMDKLFKDSIEIAQFVSSLTNAKTSDARMQVTAMFTQHESDIIYRVL